VNNAHVLGASLGGFVAQELALKRPDLVARLVFVSTGHGGRGAERMSLGAMGRMFGLGAFSPKKAARRGLEGATSERYRAENPEEFDRRAAPRRVPLAVCLLRAGESRLALRRLGRGRAHKLPDLVVHGAEDCYVPPANARALVQAIPGAELRVFEGAGHLVFIERAADVNREVVAFLGKTGRV